jgi:hypothetical protein
MPAADILTFLKKPGGISDSDANSSPLDPAKMILGYREILSYQYQHG